MLEYALIAALIAVVAIAGIASFGGASSDALCQTASDMGIAMGNMLVYADAPCW